MCRVICRKDALKLTAITLLCWQTMFCLYSTIEILLGLVKYPLYDGFLYSYFLNNSRNDCIVIISLVGALTALYGFYKRRYDYLLAYLAVNMASVALLLIGNVLAVMLEEVTLNWNDVVCVTAVSVSYSLMVGVTMKFYQTTKTRAKRNGDELFVDGCDVVEYDDEDIELDFVDDVAAKNVKLDERYYSDYVWLADDYRKTYDAVADRDRYLKNLLKRGF